MKTQTITKVIETLARKEGITMLGGFRQQKMTPFEILIATILSARARDEVTSPISKNLFKKYPDAKRLAKAQRRDVEKIIKPIGFYRVKAKHIIETARKLCDDFNCGVPATHEQLMTLPGVGRKVAGCVLVYAHGKDAIPVDTHVHRLSNRLGWVRTKTPEQTEQKLIKIVPLSHWQLVNDVLVIHGKTICLPQNPKCSICPVRKWCKRVGVEKSR